MNNHDIYVSPLMSEVNMTLEGFMCQSIGDMVWGMEIDEYSSLNEEDMEFNYD